MRILHFSDIHMPTENNVDFKHFIVNSFLNDLSMQQKEAPFDVICLTGDIVDKGAQSFQDRENWGKSFLDALAEPLLQELSLTRDKFLIVPGNHDMWRDNDSNMIELGMEHSLKTVEDVNKHFEIESTEGICRTLPFKKFQKQFYADITIPYVMKRHHMLLKQEIAGVSVGIACLHTAWRSYSDEKDRHGLILGERQIVDAIDYLDECTVKIALMHHPVDWLCEFDRKCVEPMLEKSFQLVFCGHQHSATSWTKSDVYNGIFVSIAPCNWVYGIRNTAMEFSNGYSVIDFDETNNSIKVANRRYSYKKGKYVSNNDLGDDSGILKFQLPSSSEMLKLQYELNLAKHIKYSHFDELNEHLLTFNTDTKAPQNIESIYVYPRIVEKIELNGEKKKKKDKESPVAIESICTSEEHLLIFGVKESGKTLLLDDILIQLTNNITKYHRTPVAIDFKRVGNSRIETLIARYLGISITCIKEFLSEHTVVLLIDNLTFSSYVAKGLNNLESFCLEYPRCRIIGCAKQAFEGGIPVEVYEYPFFSAIKKLHIKAFGATETRKLIKQWFSTHPQQDIDGKIEKLLDTLLQLNLPRTPLAISMFLWILEQQENYEPVNNASMIENFVEKLFSKHAKREIYSDRFDFKNKVRLLAEIAYKMLTVDDTDYRMSSRELIDFIDDHLKANKFDLIEARTVLEHFLTHGVLMQEHDGESEYIRFRFACFMHYFLMNKMEFDPTFRAEVLNPANMLMYTDEIELYTGTKRDAVDILNTVIEQMQAAFAGIVAAIEKLPKTFDEIFAPYQSIAASADESFITKLSGKQKPTQEEVDAMRDEVLDQIQFEKGIKKKMLPINKKKEMELLWTLSAQVLRNTEETKVIDLKYRTYSAVLKCSMAYAFLWKLIIDKFISENQKNPDFVLDEELKIQRDALPLFHELWLRMLLGSKKLSVVIHEKIISDKSEQNVSDFERFISVFLYADIHGRAALKVLKEFVKTVKHPKLVDMTLFKLLGYYFLRSKTKENDKEYENLIGNLLINARGLPKKNKGGIIQHYRDKRTADGRSIKKA
jgi:predicted MPP superfamily phosphohydrolase